MTEAQKIISLQILAKIENGMNGVEAIKSVLGADVAEKFIDNLYNALRSM